jgi:hypothetical protein
MSRVTDRAKCYVYVCLGCDCLDQGRKDQTTCSAACRVRVHRHPEQMQRLRAVAVQMDITVALIQQAAAIRRLRPDLADPLRAGTLTIAGAQPEMHRAFWALVWKAAAASGNNCSERGAA